MLNLPCPMIQDLLPLYVDQICSQESRRAVEEHVENCPLCRARLEELRREDPLPPPEQDREQSKARVLAEVKRQLRRKKLCFSARVLAGAAALGCWSFASRHPFPIHRISASRRWSRLSTWNIWAGITPAWRSCSG